MIMKQDFDKISKTLSTVSYDGLKESPLANFCLNTRNRYVHIFPALYKSIVFICVKHIRVSGYHHFKM